MSSFSSFEIRWRDGWRSPPLDGEGFTKQGGNGLGNVDRHPVPRHICCERCGRDRFRPDTAAEVPGDRYEARKRLVNLLPVPSGPPLNFDRVCDPAGFERGHGCEIGFESGCFGLSPPFSHYRKPLGSCPLQESGRVSSSEPAFPFNLAVAVRAERYEILGVVTLGRLYVMYLHIVFPTSAYATGVIRLVKKVFCDVPGKWLSSTWGSRDSGSLRL